MKKNLLVISGVRPQYIKTASFLAEFSFLKEKGITPILIDVGQHYSKELSRNLKRELGLVYDYEIRHSLPCHPLKIIANSLSNISHFINELTREPIGVVVFGDANPALVGAIAAKEYNLPLIHIEAGARRDPNEQEHKNSKIVDSLANLKLCVTERAKNELNKEGNGENSLVTGDLACNWYKDIFLRLGLVGKEKYNGDKLLVTLHRPLNMDDHVICKIYKSLAEIKIKTKWVTHPRVEKHLLKIQSQNSCIELLKPQSFQNILKLMSWATCVLTDSGGVARESHYLRKPVLMRRNLGGWPELREINVLRNVSYGSKDIMEALEWSRVVVDNYPEEEPFYKKGGVEVGMKAILDVL